MRMPDLRCAGRSGCAFPGLDGLDGVFKGVFQDALAISVPTTRPSAHPLRFLPSRTTTTSMSVVPSG